MTDFERFEEKRRKLLAEKSMKKTYSTVGWAVLALIAVWFSFLTLVGLVFGVLEVFGIAAMPFYERYMLVFNELGLALAIFVAMAVLKTLPEYEGAGEKFGIGKFFAALTACFAIGMVGNLIGSAMLAIWNGLTGFEAGGEVDAIIESADGFILVLMVGVCAPFLEEFFFRKLLIDRLRGHGELAAILLSAVFFGLFHGNFSQFFYAAGLGVLLGYIYAKSGSFLSVFLLHAAFNCLSGLLPTFLLGEENEMLYMIYTVVYLVVVVLGLIFAIFGATQARFQKSEPAISSDRAVSAACLNGGVIAAVLVMFIMMLMSLFAL